MQTRTAEQNVDVPKPQVVKESVKRVQDPSPRARFLRNVESTNFVDLIMNTWVHNRAMMKSILPGL